MVGMRRSVCVLLAGLQLALCGRLAAEQRFELTASIEKAATLTNSEMLKIELKNVSGELQKVRMLEHLFEGTVYLRDASGDTYPFIHRQYWNMLVTSTWLTPEVKFAPGASHVFRHDLSDFIDSQRSESWRIAGRHDSYAVLSEEFGRGCEIWCELKIRETRPFGKRSTFAQLTETVRSAPLIDIRPALLYDPSARTFQKNPFVRDYAPVLTTEEQEQSKTGEQLYAEYEEGRAKERARYLPPLRSLMEARDTPDDSDLNAYKHALNEIRKNPAPELFRQFAESIDEGTCEVRGILENVLFDGYLKLEPWQEENWQKAMRALVDSLPHVRTREGLQHMLIFIVQAKGIGRLQFEIAGTDAKVDVRATRTTHGSTSAWPCVENVSQDLLAQVSQECSKLLRKRYPELRAQ